MLQPLLVSHYQQVYSKPKPVCWHHRHIIPLVTLHTHAWPRSGWRSQQRSAHANATSGKKTWRVSLVIQNQETVKKSSLLDNLANNKFRCQNGLLKKMHWTISAFIRKIVFYGCNLSLVVKTVLFCSLTCWFIMKGFLSWSTLKNYVQASASYWMRATSMWVKQRQQIKLCKKLSGNQKWFKNKPK